jgi:hypothetical protein
MTKLVVNEASEEPPTQGCICPAPRQYLSLGFELRHVADPHYRNVNRNRNVMPAS